MANKIVRKIANEHVFTLEESSVSTGNKTIKVYMVAGVTPTTGSSEGAVRDNGGLTGLNMFDR